jgi:hypothetical protein
MGFRDIKKINLAMLGKQGCCLMTKPSSLYASVKRQVLSKWGLHGNT